MGKKSKIISLIVSVAMLVAMFPMIVHADGNPYPDDPSVRYKDA